MDPCRNLLCRAYRLWWEDAGHTPPGVRFEVDRRIPLGKGLGSSAAACVAGLAAAAFAAEDKAPADRIVRLATQLEGHPDNVAPATLGGVVAVIQDGDAVRATPIASHLSLGVALFVPEAGLDTQKARDILPATVPLTDAVFNVGRAAYLTAALIWGRWELIGPAMEDRLHQPYRARLIPALEAVIATALSAGAFGAALSGGGPSVIALGPAERAGEFAAAMEACALGKNWPGKAMVTRVRHRGVEVRKL